MHFYNYLFTPFGLILIIFALTLSSPEKKDTIVSIVTLIIQFSLNFYILKNLYTFKKPNSIRSFLVLFNIITTSIVFYHIMAYWAPSWLLYIIPPVFASTFLNRNKTLVISLFSAISMLFIYWLRSYILELSISHITLAMAICHALFIIVISLFVNSMSELITKIRGIK